MNTCRLPVLLFALCALMAHRSEARAAGTCPSTPHVTIGGVTGFQSLVDPAATAQLRASCKVGLYLHAEAWKVLDDDSKARVLANFAGTGPAVVELGFVATPRGYMKNFYKPTFVDKGVHADTALVNGLCHDGTAAAEAYVTEARAVGLTTVAPVFAPNSGQYRQGGFQSPAFDCVREAAAAGGALAIDAPPHVFFALRDGYQPFVIDEVRWANQKGLKSYFIISPNGSGRDFADESDRLLRTLTAAGAKPSDIVFETYDIHRTDVANQVGNERDSATVAGTALRLLPHLAH